MVYGIEQADSKSPDCHINPNCATHRKARKYSKATKLQKALQQIFQNLRTDMGASKNRAPNIEPKLQ